MDLLLPEAIHRTRTTSDLVLPNTNFDGFSLSPRVESIIEDAMRRDTAAPRFGHVPFRGMGLFVVDCVVQNANSSFMV